MDSKVKKISSMKRTKTEEVAVEAEAAEEETAEVEVAVEAEV